MNLLNFKNNICKKILCLIPLSLLYFPPSYAELKIEFEDPDSMVETIFREADNTMGKRVGAKKVNWSWGDCGGSSYYESFRNFICLRDELKNKKLALAFTTAHEYAHHIQKTIYGPLDRESMNILKIELQADCFAGYILAKLPNMEFDENDIVEMLGTANLSGDKDYDDHINHHGSGENRVLALRSGFRYGITDKKDLYFSMFCLQD